MVAAASFGVDSLHAECARYACALKAYSEVLWRSERVPAGRVLVVLGAAAAALLMSG